jgi:hypothetical protein
MMGDYPVRPQVDLPLIRNIFGRIGVPQVTSILQTREISYIGIDELQDIIVIFTKRKLSVREYFARIHKSLRVSPAMAAGLTDRLWDVADIVDLLDAAEEAPKRPATYRKRAAAA